jgi:sigma-B regulation protein RsbU (phosphoserine phosphatase)
MSDRILIIDDEPSMLRAVERILGHDHTVSSATSPEEGIELAGRVNPDLVICDISMPRLDGFETVAQVRRVRPDVDVILMTGLSEPEAHLVRAIRERAFYFIEKPFNREVMRALVERCLELRRLREAERRHARRIDRELSEARAFQQTMLPPPRATVGGVDITARYVACSELCGDIFDYAPAGANAAAVLVADVSGHGVSAALLTAVVKSAFRSSAAEGYDPESVARRVMTGISTFSDRRFVTLIAARIDSACGELRFVNAGHPPGIMRSATGALRRLPSTGAMLSPAFAGEAWTSSIEPLERGDDLLLFTDGITDAPGEGGTFSESRLLEVTGAVGDGSDVLLDAVLDAVASFARGRPPSDDLTLLTARLAAAP